MILTEIEFSQFEGKPKEWKLENCTLNKINLIAGKNATGKTKLLTIIRVLSNILSGKRTIQTLLGNGNYKVTFNKDGKKVVYILKYGEGHVLEENLFIDSKNLLNRSIDGEGKIFFSKVGKGDYVNFHTPTKDVAAFVRRDKIQHDFLEALYEWGNNLIFFYFGTSLGKEVFQIFVKTDEERPDKYDVKDTNLAPVIFKRGMDKFGDSFKTSIIKDMARIAYPLNDIKIGPLESIRIDGNFPSTLPEGILLEESDLPGKTDQIDISQGMYRALVVIIIINYVKFYKEPSCVLIDDIGEGLDFERSSGLIKLLIEKSKNLNSQLIMSTNDRYVMNNVPLEDWSIIQRQGNRSIMINYKNSPKIFDEFESTGLSNFDFFSSNYYLGTSKQK